MPDVIIPFDGNHSSVPSGWSRDTRFDGKYPKATTSDWGNTGGSSTHSHTSSAHTHSYSDNNHTHSIDITGGSTRKDEGRHQDAPDYAVATNPHTHSTDTTSTATSASVSSDSPSIGNADNEYSRYELIFIKGSVYNAVPVDGIVMKDDTDSHISASHFDDLDGKYTKGSATDTNAGTTATVSNHSHTQSHTHTQTHDHSNFSSGNVEGMLGTNATGQECIDQHSHTIYISAANTTLSNSTALPTTTNELAYQELHFWKISSKVQFQIGDIVISTEATVPPGWDDLGYDNVYIKGKAEGESLSSGGSNTHTHSGINHSHSGQSHTHSFSSSTATHDDRDRLGGGSFEISGTHSHSGTTGSSSTNSTGSTNMTFNTVNHEPEYIKVRYIKKEFDMGGATFFMNLV